MTLVSDQGAGRFRDPLVRLGRFAGEVLVRCPTCGECATVLAHLGAPEFRAGGGRRVARRRLRCRACGLAEDAFPVTPVFGEPADPYFRQPLWLQADCRGHLLWAYNAGHLDLLESYVAARLRERGPIPGTMSLVERLPAWLKSAKNRADVLRLIRRLRASLPTEPPEVRK